MPAEQALYQLSYRPSKYAVLAAETLCPRSVALTRSAYAAHRFLAGQTHEEALYGHEVRHQPNRSHAPECRGPRTVGHVVFVRHLRAASKPEQTVTAYRYAADGLSAFLADRGMPTRADRPDASVATFPLVLRLGAFSCSYDLSRANT